MIARTVEAQYVGTAVLDRADEPVGEVRRVYLDEAEQPVWASVRVAVLDSEVLVPLERAAWDERALHLAVTTTQALGAYGQPCTRSPRADGGAAPVGEQEVCYSVRDGAPGQ